MAYQGAQAPKDRRASFDIKKLIRDLDDRVTAASGGFLPLGGGTLTGAVTGTALTLSGHLSGATATFSGLVTAATAPTSGSHLTNKTYVDGQVSSHTHDARYYTETEIDASQAAQVTAWQAYADQAEADAVATAAADATAKVNALTTDLNDGYTFGGTIGVTGTLSGAAATFTGAVTAATAPSSGSHLANKTYVDSKDTTTLSSAATAATTYTDGRVLLAQMNGTNMVPNGSFEDGLKNWVALNANATVALETTDRASGKQSAKVTVVSPTSGGAMILDGFIPVVPGRKYTISAMMKHNLAGATPGTHYFRVTQRTWQLFGASVPFVDLISNQSNSLLASWGLKSFTWTAPSDTYYIRFDFFNLGSSTGSLLIDSVTMVPQGKQTFEEVVVNSGAGTTASVIGTNGVAQLILDSGGTTGTMDPRVLYRDDGVTRWQHGMDESDGKKWQLSRYNTSGVFQDNPLDVDASTGEVRAKLGYAIADSAAKSIATSTTVNIDGFTSTSNPYGWTITTNGITCPADGVYLIMVQTVWPSGFVLNSRMVIFSLGLRTEYPATTAPRGVMTGLQYVTAGTNINAQLFQASGSAQNADTKLFVQRVG